MSTNGQTTATAPAAGAAELAALIDRRAGRAAKAILRFKDLHLDPIVDPGISGDLRKVVLDELNDLADTAKELLAVIAARADESVVLNEVWLAKIDEVHRALVIDGDG